MGSLNPGGSHDFASKVPPVGGFDCHLGSTDIKILFMGVRSDSVSVQTLDD